MVFFIVRTQRGAVLLKTSGIKYEMKFAILKNYLTSIVLVELGALSKAVVQSWVDVTT